MLCTTTGVGYGVAMLWRDVDADDAHGYAHERLHGRVFVSVSVSLLWPPRHTHTQSRCQIQPANPGTWYKTRRHNDDVARKTPRISKRQLKKRAVEIGSPPLYIHGECFCVYVYVGVALLCAIMSLRIH